MPNSTESSWVFEQIHELVATCATNGYDISTKPGQDYLFRLAFEWDEKIRDRWQQAFVKRDFYPELARLTGIDLSDICDIFEAQHAEALKKKHDKLVFEALQGATDLVVATRDHSQVRSFLNEKLGQAEAVLVGQVVKPIRTVADAADDLWADLLSTQGVPFIGLTQEVIPELDIALDGFQGLNLITAKSGEGKTMFAIQAGLELLDRHDDVCVLFVSLDMNEARLLRRIATNRSRIDMNALRKGSGKGGWTEAEQEAAHRAIAEVRRLGRRWKIIDRGNCSSITRQVIAKERDKLKRETGCDKCVIVFDFLQLMECPAGMPESQQDEWRIEEMRILADEMDPQPVICITESVKGTAYERGSAANVKGSNRIVMRSDIVITLNSFSEDELLDTWDINESSGYLSFRPTKEPYTDKKKPGERAVRAARIRKALQKRGEAPIMLKIDKGRDGAEKGEMFVINHFRKNYFTPLVTGI